MAGSKDNAMLMLCGLIEKLPAVERSVFILAIVQRRRTEDVGRTLDLSVEDTRAALTRALIHLRSDAEVCGLDLLTETSGLSKN